MGAKNGVSWPSRSLAISQASPAAIAHWAIWNDLARHRPTRNVRDVRPRANIRSRGCASMRRSCQTSCRRPRARGSASLAVRVAQRPLELAEVAVPDPHLRLAAHDRDVGVVLLALRTRLGVGRREQRAPVVVEDPEAVVLVALDLDD